MNYDLKDKITVTKEFLTELELKGWQEIEHLQAQIANLAEGPANDKLRQLFKNLLTSYYVFTGGIELLNSEPIENTQIIKAEVPSEELIQSKIPTPEVLQVNDSVDEVIIDEQNTDYEVNDPFEYFVDFDDPIGEPITDKDLYNN